MIVMENCCCCFSLRTGSLIVGYLNLIGDIILAIITILGLSAGISLSTSGTDDTGIGNILLIISAVLLCFITLFIVFNVILLVGLHKDRPVYVKAYVIYGLVFLVIYIALFIASLFLGSTSAGYIVGKVFEIFLGSYFLLVIWSQYVKMKEARFNQARA